MLAISLSFFLPLIGEPPSDLLLDDYGFTEEVWVVEDVELQEDEVLELPAFRQVQIRRLVAAEGARIRFPAHQSAPNGEDGVSGGNGGEVTIIVDSLDGHVVIESRGGDGGDGQDGRDGRMGLVGGKGRDAPRLFFFRIGQGSPGRPGGAGENGEDGGDGGDGGQGGVVRVFYKEKTPGSKVVVDVSGGQGGRAGKGGRGGLGGPGGPGGRGWVQGPQGPMGEHGSPGRPGHPGRPGRPGEALVLELSAHQFNCVVLWETSVFQTEEELWTCLLG